MYVNEVGSGLSTNSWSFSHVIFPHPSYLLVKISFFLLQQGGVERIRSFCLFCGGRKEKKRKREIDIEGPSV
jgi:hypothetical protein